MGQLYRSVQGDGVAGPGYPVLHATWSGVQTLPNGQLVRAERSLRREPHHDSPTGTLLTAREQLHLPVLPVPTTSHRCCALRSAVRMVNNLFTPKPTCLYRTSTSHSHNDQQCADGEAEIGASSARETSHGFANANTCESRCIQLSGYTTASTSTLKAASCTVQQVQVRMRALVVKTFIVAVTGPHKNSLIVKALIASKGTFLMCSTHVYGASSVQRQGIHQ